MVDVKIIVPTYYGGKMVLNCVQSILENVKDPQILIVKNSIGWLAACNKAMQSTKDDILLLNDDTIVISDIVKEMQTLAYTEPLIGIVGGKALAPDAETIINFGIHIATDGNTAHRYFGQAKNSVGVEKQKAVEGSAMYIKRDLLEEIGYFDEKYGMGYRAEVAYCFEAREAGWKVYSSPTAEYIHLTSQTTGRLGIANDTHEIFMEDWGKKLKLGLI